VTSNERTPADLLGSILAIIHGDGGHYQAKHGDAKATEDAIAKYYATRFDALCPHGMPLAENVCGPCSQGRPNKPAAETSDECEDADYLEQFIKDLPNKYHARHIAGIAERIRRTQKTSAEGQS
jgi:hypothetical protein